MDCEKGWNMEAWWESLKPGHHVDVLDSVGKWCVCQILLKQHDRMHVHYTGWSAKWDEWVLKDFNKIAPLHSKCHPDTPSEIKVKSNSTDPRLHINTFDSQVYRDLTSLYQSTELVDMTIISLHHDDTLRQDDQDDQPLHAHFAIVKARCPALFLHLNKSQDDDIPVFFTEIPHHVVKVLVEYCYMGYLVGHSSSLNNSVLALVLHFSELLDLKPLYSAARRKISTSVLPEIINAIPADIKYLAPMTTSILQLHIDSFIQKEDLTSLEHVFDQHVFKFFHILADENKRGDSNSGRDERDDSKDLSGHEFIVGDHNSLRKEDGDVLMHDLRSMFNDRSLETCDFAILLDGCVEPIYAHKCILCK
jgi:hypothetical protein